ncbi:zinc finger protein 83-like isoform X1 [Schistocerca piceifrons]|uniref:zinc finger protein 83-like isoform X1 n=2 Tax=Schistocerca piceifrons TaxID=274613 RepID=UPI001F5FEE2E|nr:zinc finger protein 83-like isoform X1 [Schistocerca piceifrons]XP_047101302.1 zinc finger protein 83-like isoform X1 [Schistocerca piceifrons]
MEHEAIGWVKKEVMQLEPSSALLEEPSGIATSSEDVKMDPELKVEVTASEWNVYPLAVDALSNCDLRSIKKEVPEEPLAVSEFTSCIKEEPDLDLGIDTTDSNVISNVQWKLRASSFCSASNMSVMGNNCGDFTCSTCLQRFSSKYSLIMHVFIHIDAVDVPSHVCRCCGEVFHSDDCLNKHMMKKEEDRTLIAHPLADTRKLHKCSGMCSCGQFTNIDHVSQRCYSEPDNYSLCRNNSKLVSTCTVHTKPHKCGKCCKSFAYASRLQAHAVVHSGIKSYKCDVCGKLFARCDHLKNHKLVHSKVKSYKCDVCGKLFARVHNLKNHSLVHSGVKSYKCDTCGKLFARVHNLNAHTVMHLGVKSHKCHVCEKLFTRIDNLKSHILLHSKVKSHKCNVCGKMFARADYLKYHEEALHPGMKPHKCDVCGECFATLRDVKYHLLVHSGA